MIKMKKEPKRLGNVADSLIRKWKSRKAERGQAIKTAWAEATSEEEKKHAQVVNYRNGILTVIVENSPWLYKLTLEKRELLKKFNSRYTGRKKAQDIRFRIGSFDAE
jgi:predicted nucleic acid-binding Zn ribbon protein